MGMTTICFYHLYLHHKGQRATKHSSLQTEYTWGQKMPFISKTRANLGKLISFLESVALNSFQHSWHKRKKFFCCALIIGEMIGQVSLINLMSMFPDKVAFLIFNVFIVASTSSELVGERKNE